MGQLMNLPQMNQVARDMAREMEKMGIIDEMVEESFDMIDDDDIEEIADQEVDKLLYEITKGQIGALPNAPIRPGVEKDEKEQELDDDKEMEEMKARLAGLAE